MTTPHNRFSSLIDEPVRKKQPETKPPPENKPPPETKPNGFKTPLETKSNRFNFSEDDLKPQKKEQRFTESSNRPNFRDRNQFERDRRAKDEADALERKKIELERSLTDAASFPELVAQQKPITQIETNDLNFLEKVKMFEDSPMIEWSDCAGATETNEKEPPIKQTRSNTTYAVISKLVELHETWKANYIAEYGEDYYQHYYRFPNYDYEYFDKLDDKYEAELEELERLEEEKDADQYIEYNSHYDE